MSQVKDKKLNKILEDLAETTERINNSLVKFELHQSRIQWEKQQQSI